MELPLILIIIGITCVAGVCVVAYEIKKSKARMRALWEGYGGPSPNPKALREARHYWQGLPPQVAAKHVDDITWANLEMDEVFLYVNRCQTDAGDILLYKALRFAGAPQGPGPPKQALVAAMQGDVAFRKRAVKMMAGIGRQHNGAQKALTLDIAMQRLHRKGVVYTLAALAVLAIPALFMGNAVLAVAALAILGANLVANYVLKSVNPAYGGVFALSAINAKGAALATLLQGIDDDTAAVLRSCTKRFKPIRLPLFIMWASNLLQTLFLPDFLGVFQLPLLSYAYVLRFLQRNKNLTDSLFTAVGTLDMAYSVASLREGLPLYCPPTFSNEENVRFAGLYHPLLSAPVQNDFAPAGNVLLTGSNASGKSTFIKTVAANLLLGQALHTCCAAKATLRPGHIMAAMAVQDSLVDGDSYFVAELKATKRIFTCLQQGGFHYVFMDEILRGTNTTQRVAAAGALLWKIASFSCFCMAATHDMELTDTLQDIYEMYYFEENIQNNDISFDYKLKKGKSPAGNAVTLMAAFGFPQDVVRTAKEAINTFGSTGRWEKPNTKAGLPRSTTGKNTAPTKDAPRLPLRWARHSVPARAKRPGQNVVRGRVKKSSGAKKSKNKHL